MLGSGSKNDFKELKKPRVRHSNIPYPWFLINLSLGKKNKAK